MISRFVLASMCLVTMPLSAVAQDSLSIVSSDAEHAFTVEVVASEEAIAQGMMGRESLADDAGMLFDFGGVQTVEMWMKDTPLPLDMLFLDAGGQLVAIARNAAPGSERRISPGVPVRAVLELNGGAAERIDIAPGDTVAHSLFASEEAG